MRRAPLLRKKAEEAPLRRYLRSQLSSPVTTPLFKGCDHGLRTASVAHTDLGRSMWDAAHYDVFEGNAKHQWVTEEHCYLCDEAVGSPNIHLADRDHVCLGLFLYLHTLFPRQWDARHSLARAVAFPTLHRHAVCVHLSQDHLHTAGDAMRRAELRAIIEVLADPPHNAITLGLRGKLPGHLWSSGERVFKANLTRLAAVALPPMAPGVHSAFTQKCWGRSNMERMYEALDIAALHRGYGVDPKMTRDTRAFFMRVLVLEIHTALDTRPLSDVARVLCEAALRRISFELMFLQSMYYMNRVQALVRRMEYPALPVLHDLNCT